MPIDGEEIGYGAGPALDFDDIIRTVRQRRTAQEQAQRKASRRGVAIHEAAHAIVAAELGVRCDGASVVPDGTSDGRADIVIYSRAEPGDPDAFVVSREKLLAQVCVLLAGGLAEMRTDPAMSLDYAMVGTDYPRALELAQGMTDDDAAAEKCITDCRVFVEALLREPSVWRTVELLATVLQQARAVDAAMIAAVAAYAANRDHVA